jgi:hypothetical protein
MTQDLESKFDCIWFCRNLYRDNWTEYFELKRRGRHAEADEKLALYGNQFEVMLSVWEDRATSAIYKFLNESDARRFYTGEGLRQGEQCWLRERAFCPQFDRFICFDYHALRMDDNTIGAGFGVQLDVDVQWCYREDRPHKLRRASGYRISLPNVGRRVRKSRR